MELADRLVVRVDIIGHPLELLDVFIFSFHELVIGSTVERLVILPAIFFPLAEALKNAVSWPLQELSQF